jgi:hypothetical protein
MLPQNSDIPKGVCEHGQIRAGILGSTLNTETFEFSGRRGKISPVPFSFPVDHVQRGSGRQARPRAGHVIPFHCRGTSMDYLRGFQMLVSPITACNPPPASHTPQTQPDPCRYHSIGVHTDADARRSTPLRPCTEPVTTNRFPKADGRKPRPLQRRSIPNKRPSAREYLAE